MAVVTKKCHYSNISKFILFYFYSSEDDPVGTKVLTIKARDGDSGQARKIIYNLDVNPNGYFAIDQTKGDITIDKPINR